MNTELMQLEAVEQEETVLAMQSRATTLAGTAARIVVTDEASDQHAAGFVIELAAAQKEAEKIRKSFTTPLTTAKKNIDAFFKRMTTPFAEARTVVDDKRKAYFLEEQRKQQEEAERIRKENEKREKERILREAEQIRLEEEAAAKNEPPPEPPKDLEPLVVTPPAPPPPAQTVRGRAGGSSTMRDHWTFEIVDREKIPARWWVVDEKAIRAAVTGGEREIPGLHIYNDPVIATRTG